MKEAELEFELLSARLDGRSKVETPEFEFTIDGDKISGQAFVKPINFSEGITVKLNDEGGDRFVGGFKPFSMIQEEFYDEIDGIQERDGSDEEKSLIVFLMFNEDFVKKLKEKQRERIIGVLETRRKINVISN